MERDYPNGAYYARSNLSHWNSQGRRESGAYAGFGEFLWDRQVLYLTELIIEIEISVTGFELSRPKGDRSTNRQSRFGRTKCAPKGVRAAGPNQSLRARHKQKGPPCEGLSYSAYASCWPNKYASIANAPYVSLACIRRRSSPGSVAPIAHKSGKRCSSVGWFSAASGARAR